jgi:hypothetical protein
MGAIRNNAEHERARNAEIPAALSPNVSAGALPTSKGAIDFVPLGFWVRSMTNPPAAKAGGFVAPPGGEGLPAT